MSLIIAGFEIDVALIEDPSFDSEITSHPVESGPDISDHWRNLPVVLNVEGLVSDVPFGAIAERRKPNTLPSEDAYAFLKQLRDHRQPFTVETSRDVFTNMAIVNLSPPTSSRNGLRFRASFRQIRIIENEFTTVQVETPRSAKKINRGTKPVATGPTVAEVAKARGLTIDQLLEQDQMLRRRDKLAAAGQKAGL